MDKPEEHVEWLRKVIAHSTPPDYSGNVVSKFEVENSGRNSILQKRAKNNKFKVPLKTQYIWA